MKLKFLGVFSAVMFLCGDSIFARNEVDDRSIDFKNTKAFWENKAENNIRSSYRDRFNRKSRLDQSEFEGKVDEDLQSDNKTSEGEVDEDLQSDNKTGEGRFVSDSQESSVNDDENLQNDDRSGFSNLSSDFAKFSDTLKFEFSRSLKNFSEIEREISNFSEKLENSEASPEQQKRAASLKSDIENCRDKISKQIEELEQIQKDLDDLRIDEKIAELKKMQLKISNMVADISRKQAEIRTALRKMEKEQKKIKEEKKPVDWEKIKKYSEELGKYFETIRLFDVRQKVVMKGTRYFGKDSEYGKDLFDLNQKIDPALKGLFKQIYDKRYPEAEEILSKLSETNNKDPNYQELLNNLRKAVEALKKNIFSLVKQKSTLEAEVKEDVRGVSPKTSKKSRKKLKKSFSEQSK